MAGTKDQISTALCDVEALVAVDEGRVTEADLARFGEAVDAALVACEAASPCDRFRLVETAGGNFLLVTNALPRERYDSSAVPSPAAGASPPSSDGETATLGSPEKDVFARLLDVEDEDDEDGLGGGEAAVAGFAVPPPEYAFCAAGDLSYDGRLAGGSYVIYTREQLRRGLRPDRRAAAARLLRFVDAPGVLDHNNVADAEALIWLLFCGPRSLCRRETCFGRERGRRRGGVPFQALLPPIFYEATVADRAAYVNLAELYVYSWYRDFEFTPEVARAYELGEAGAARVARTLASVRRRFADRRAPVWPGSSRICIFCALYNQNRLCLDLAARDASLTAYSPIVIRDARDAATDVVFSHVLPDARAVSLFPVYDIGSLLRLLVDEEGEPEEVAAEGSGGGGGGGDDGVVDDGGPVSKRLRREQPHRPSQQRSRAVAEPDL